MRDNRGSLNTTRQCPCASQIYLRSLLPLPP
jgi:hypothetical protein